MCGLAASLPFAAQLGAQQLPDEPLGAGKFLVAERSLVDPNFARTVVVVLRYGPGGAMGLIVNRRTEETLADRFPDLSGERASKIPVYHGGPVSPERWFALLRSDKPVEGAVHAFDEIYVTDDAAALARLVRRWDPASFRVYFGYAGWAPGQLDHEVLRGGWRIVPASAAEIFDSSPGTLWRRLIPPALENVTRAWPSGALECGGG